MLVELLAVRIAEGDFTGLVDISVELEDFSIIESLGNRARCIYAGEETADKFLAERLAEGHPTKLSEALRLFEVFDFSKQAQEARNQLPKVASAYLAVRLTEGHPTKLREALRLFEVSDFPAQAKEARAQLSQVATAYLAARLADAAPDIPLLVDAIFEAEAEGLSAQANEARAQLPRLVIPIS